MECNERDSSNNRHTIDLFSRFVLFFRRVVSCRDGINKYIKYDNKEKEKEGNNETHEFSRSRIQSGRKQRGGSLSLLHKRPTANSQQPTANQRNQIQITPTGRTGTGTASAKQEKQNTKRQSHYYDNFKAAKEQQQNKTNVHALA